MINPHIMMIFMMKFRRIIMSCINNIENIKELESLIQNNRKKVEEILSIGTTYKVDRDTVKAVTKEEATELGKLYNVILL